jgi:hypothetical protein
VPPPAPGRGNQLNRKAVDLLCRVHKVEVTSAPMTTIYLFYAHANTVLTEQGLILHYGEHYSAPLREETNDLGAPNEWL